MVGGRITDGLSSEHRVSPPQRVCHAYTPLPKNGTDLLGVRSARDEQHFPAQRALVETVAQVGIGSSGRNTCHASGVCMHRWWLTPWRHHCFFLLPMQFQVPPVPRHACILHGATVQIPWLLLIRHWPFFLAWTWFFYGIVWLVCLSKMNICW